jgi:hypothetical protein
MLPVHLRKTDRRKHGRSAGSLHSSMRLISNNRPKQNRARTLPVLILMSAKQHERAMVLTSIVIAFASVGQLIFYFVRDFIRPQTQHIFEFFLGALILILLGLGVWAINHLRKM